jgi:hypothetical protein
MLRLLILNATGVGDIQWSTHNGKLWIFALDEQYQTRSNDRLLTMIVPVMSYIYFPVAFSVVEHNTKSL